MLTNHPEPTHPPSPSVPGPTKFRLPRENTLVNSLIDCGRAGGRALAGIARLLGGRPV